MVVDEGKQVRDILTEKGYHLIVGNGTLEEAHLKECDAIIPGKAYITEEVLAQAPNLKIVSKFGVGVEKIDIPACTSRGIYVTNTPTANFTSVAEHTVMLLLAAAKKMHPISMHLSGANVDWFSAKQYQGTELSGKILSLIGFGNIGRQVAKLLSCFGMHIIAYDPYIEENRVPDYVELTRDLEYALSMGDFVSLHVAGIDSTRHLMNEKTLVKMKPNAILINTTRGFVIDETALITALQKGVIAGAALDVFETEPALSDNPLLHMENVIATPHNAGNTPEARLRAQITCAENIIEFFDGSCPPYALNHF